MDTHRSSPRVCHHTAALALGALLAAPAAALTTWNVPGDYPSIHAALGFSSDGDIIEVEPGTYHEYLDTFGKTLTLRGLGGADVTIVDATGWGKSALTISSGAPLIEGLTLSGGAPPSGAGNGGGGVAVADGTPTLIDCIIRDNTVTLKTGGGVYGATPAVVTLKGCTLRGNKVISGGVGGGAANKVLLEDCLVEDNSASIGGGLYNVLGATGCVIRNNTATSYGGGVALSLDKISDCVIQGNTATVNGGGMYASVIVPAGGMLPPVADVTLLQNTAATGGGLYYTVSGTPLGVGATLTRVVIADNLADSANDGAYVSVGGFLGSGDVIVQNCTFGTDRLYALAGALKVSNTIAWGLTGALQWAGIGTGLQVSYSDVKGGVAGTGNMNIDPLFTDAASGDYSLQYGSPCIDKGDPASPPDPDGTPADIGALPYDPWTDLGHALAGAQGEPVLQGTGLLTGGSLNTLELSHAPAGVAGTLVLGFSELDAPFKGGVMVPHVDAIFPGLGTGALGGFSLPFVWPVGLPPGLTVFLQCWLPDAGGPKGFAASNGLRLMPH